MDRLVDFASSVPDFRRTGKGNHRHRLRDIIMLMVLGRASGFVGRADIIAFGKHNIKRLLRKMGMLKNGGCRPKRPFAEWITASMTAPWPTGCRNLSKCFMPSCGPIPAGDNLC